MNPDRLPVAVHAHPLTMLTATMGMLLADGTGIGVRMTSVALHRRRLSVCSTAGMHRFVAMGRVVGRGGRGLVGHPVDPFSQRGIR